jgi:2-polyprenyl-3-methyl-5-hydroxy-6-metoxy-1,4-benzoquinol methylase
MTDPHTNPSGTANDDTYRLADGIWTRRASAVHREAEYDSRGFAVLARMQEEHFWYLGRRRFLDRLITRHLPPSQRRGRRVIDLGAGCGGFIRYAHSAGLFPESTLAVADSSLEALTFCKQTLPAETDAYQIDLMDLGWSKRWDVAFLLDVIEHIPDDNGALREVFEALSPGGFCLVTVPALKQFWSWNDDAVGHQRRYSASDLSERLSGAGFRVLDARYFMFLLSPLLLVSRITSGRRAENLSDDERWALVEKSHAVPPGPINRLMSSVFNLETPLGHRLRFPWGTSVVALGQKI